MHDSAGIQRAMAKAMNAAWSVPHFGYCDEVCMDGLIKLRSQLKPMAEARGVKLSYLPMIIKVQPASMVGVRDTPVLRADRWVLSAVNRQPPWRCRSTLS